MKGAHSIAAVILTIGDELLIGQTIDTNSAWMATELNQAGIPVKRRVAVGDDWNAIWEALTAEGKAADVVLITGGLGPTSDDITKPLLCNFFGGKMVTDQAALDNVIDIFTKKINRPLLDRNLKQAEVPDNCKVIQNKRGTAPGMWFEKDGTIFVSMPGVPHEMKGMMAEDVIPTLVNRFQLSPVQHRTLLTAGIGESFLAELLLEFEAALPKDYKLAYLPNYGMVRLRLTGLDGTKDPSAIDALFEELKALVKDHLVVDEDLTLQETIAKVLLEKKNNAEDQLQGGQQGLNGGKPLDIQQARGIDLSKASIAEQTEREVAIAQLGKPVIASRLAGTSEQVINGVTGLLVEPRDVEQLGKAICYFIDNQNILPVMGCAALNQFNHCFTDKTALVNYSKMYIKLFETQK